MPNYTPRFKPGQAITFTASAAVTGGQPVEVTGDRTVGPAGAASVKYCGQAGHDAAAGEQVTVHTPGRPVHEALAAAAIAAGDHVMVAAGSRVAKFTVGADPEPARIGLALNGAAAGQPCRFLSA